MRSFSTAQQGAIEAALPGWAGVAAFTAGKDVGNSRSPSPSPDAPTGVADLRAVEGIGTDGAPAEKSRARALSAAGLLVPGEDTLAYEAFVGDFLRELSAVGTVQRTLAERAAQLAWKLKRLPAVEAAVLTTRQERRGGTDAGLGGIGNLIGELLADDDAALQRLTRYELRIERSMRACLRELRILQGHSAAGSNRTTAGGVSPTMGEAPQDAAVRHDLRQGGGAEEIAQGDGAAERGRCDAGRGNPVQREPQSTPAFPFDAPRCGDSMSGPDADPGFVLSNRGGDSGAEPGVGFVRPF